MIHTSCYMPHETCLTLAVAERILFVDDVFGLNKIGKYSLFLFPEKFIFKNLNSIVLENWFKDGKLIEEGGPEIWKASFQQKPTGSKNISYKKTGTEQTFHQN